jgi:hypothetical protein
MRIGTVRTERGKVEKTILNWITTKFNDKAE